MSIAPAQRPAGVGAYSGAPQPTTSVDEHVPPIEDSPVAPGAAAPPPPTKVSRTIAMITVVVVVLLVAVVAGLWAAGVFHTSSSSNGGGGATINVTAVNFYVTANPCWTSSGGPGGTVNAGQSFSTSWTLSYTKTLFGPASCTVQSVSSATPGFSIVSSNTPLVVDSGGSQTLSIVIETPSVASWTGVVTINVSVTAP